MDPATQGVCSECGHVNERTWVLCDECGARLPWAPPEARRRGFNEMSDEELGALFSPAPKPKAAPNLWNPPAPQSGWQRQDPFNQVSSSAFKGHKYRAPISALIFILVAGAVILWFALK